MNKWNKPSDEKTLHIGFDDTDSINGRWYYPPILFNIKYVNRKISGRIC